MRHKLTPETRPPFDRFSQNCRFLLKSAGGEIQEDRSGNSDCPPPPKPIGFEQPCCGDFTHHFHNTPCVTRMALSPTLEQKTDRLLNWLSEHSGVGVAYSGGVDSAVVAMAAQLAHPDQAVAVTAVSPSLAFGELEQATELARQIGIRHEILRTEEFRNPDYQRNAPNRCFFCKSELYSLLLQHRERLAVELFVNGANADDRGDHRPGMQAAAEYRIHSPLLELGFTKQEVRELAQHWGLPVWDKPAMPCLSSRIAYGVDVTEERVRRIDQAEQFLRDRLQLREFRVRLEAGELARLEVPLEALPRLVEPELRRELVDRLRELGFQRVTLDLEGFRSGSMNQFLPVDQLTRFGSNPGGNQGTDHD